MLPLNEVDWILAKVPRVSKTLINQNCISRVMVSMLPLNEVDWILAKVPRVRL